MSAKDEKKVVWDVVQIADGINSQWGVKRPAFAGSYEDKIDAEMYADAMNHGRFVCFSQLDVREYPYEVRPREMSGPSPWVTTRSTAEDFRRRYRYGEYAD